MAVSRSYSASESTGGFSHHTHEPASRQACTPSWCADGGVQTITRSGRAAASIAATSSPLCSTPNSSANSSALSSSTSATATSSIRSPCARIAGMWRWRAMWPVPTIATRYWLVPSGM